MTNPPTAQPVSPEAVEARLAQQDLIGALVNIYRVIEGRDCPRHLSLGMATSAVLSLQAERDALRAQSAAFDALVESLQALYNYQQRISSPDTRWGLPIYEKARAVLAQAEKVRGER